MSAKIEIFAPSLGDIQSAEVLEVLVAVGDAVSAGQALALLESDKATLEIPSPQGGTLDSLRIAPGDTVGEGSPIATLTVSQGVAPQAADAPDPTPPPAEASGPVANAAEPTPPAPAPAPVPVPDTTARSQAVPYAGPGVRRLARLMDVPLDQVQGSGPRGRILTADVHAHGQAVPAAESGTASPLLDGLGPLPRLRYEDFGPIDRKPRSRIQKKSAANLHRNWVGIPHVTNHDEADITELEAFRQQLNAERRDGEPKLSLLVFVIKACSVALARYPDFNASLDGDDLVLKRYCHIGFAADTARGLVVPVLRDVDRKGVRQIGREMAALAQTARDNQLTPAAMSGGSFSVSSLGGIGGTGFTPIINAPEVAILGLSKAVERVTWNQGNPAPRLMLPISLSWDHRAVDGAAAGRFNAFLVTLLSDFRRTLL